MRFRLLLCIAWSVVAASLVAQQSSAAEALFQRGLMLERAEGNVAQATVLYERVIAEYPNDKVVMPQALFHLARVYERSDAQRASRMWSRIVSEFGTTQYADEARRKLASQQAQTAGPFKMRSLDGAFAKVSWSDISGDGHTIAYLSEHSDQLVLRDLDSGRDRVVVSDARRKITDLEISPDGRRIAFQIHDVRTVPETEDGPHEVRILTIATGQTRTMATSPSGRSDYTWSPDSLRLAIHLGRIGSTPSGSLQVINVVSGEARKLVSPSGAAAISGPIRPPGGMFYSWSPDGKEFAMKTTNAQQLDEFWIVAAETGQVRPWTMPLKVTGPSDRVMLEWGAGATFGGPYDGGAWRGNGQIMVRQATGQGNSNHYAISPAGGPPKRTCSSVLGQSLCGQISRSGAFQFRIDQAADRVMLLDLASGSERRLTLGYGDEHEAIFSPDSKLVALVANPDGKSALYVMPIDQAPAASPVRLAILNEDPNYVDSLSWSRDGRLIVELGYSDEHVYRINMDKNGRAAGSAGRLTQDSAFAAAPAISPDSSRIAYRYRSASKQGIAVMTADGAGERPVVELSIPNHLEWINADEVIYQHRPEGAAEASLFALNVKTGATRPFVGVRGGAGFGWQFVPSRNEVVYVQGAAGEPSRTIRARSLKDGSDRAIVSVSNMLNFRSIFRVSPDGGYVAYGRWAGTGDARRPEMHLISIDGRDDRIVLTSPEATAGWQPSGYPYDWSPDGRFVLYDAHPGQLRVLDVRSGSSWQITEAVDSDSHEWWGAQWSPDGSYVAIARNGGRSEFRLFEGVTYDAVVKAMKK